ncbi:MAG: AI-2E family transporter [Pseudomonadota bacterium]
MNPVTPAVFPRWMLVALGVALLVWLFDQLRPVLTPFFIAILLAYLGDPLADRLERRMPRTAAVSVVFLGLFTLLGLLLLIVVPQAAEQVVQMSAKWPLAVDWVQHNLLPRFTAWTGIDINLDTLRKTMAGHWEQAGAVTADLAGWLFGSGMSALGWLANLVLIPVVTFYLLRDWDPMVAWVSDFLPRRIAPTINRLAKESDDVLGAFLRGQLTVMLALGTIYTLGLWMAGLEQALLFGMLAGLVSFVPYLGVIVGVLGAGLAMLIQTQEISSLLPVVAVFAVGQVLEGYVLTPKLVGEKVGLHPVAVIFAIMAGGQLFGFTGVLLALPLAAVLAVLIRHAHDRYKSSSLYGDDAQPGGAATEPDVPAVVGAPESGVAGVDGAGREQNAPKS